MLKEKNIIDVESLKREKAREWLEEMHDQKFSYLEGELSEEKFEKHKEEWVGDEMENCESDEELNEMIVGQIDELRQAYIDSVTGLERREMLFKNMDIKLGKIFDLKGDETDAKLLEIIKNDPRDFKDKEMAVMLGDISYLSLANVEGHRSGDKLLKNYGEVILAGGIEGYRHGGDEITAYFENIGENNIEAEIEDMKAEVKKLKEKLKILEDNGLEPHLDTGIAHFHEAIEVFRELLKDEAGREKLAKVKPIKELEDIWVAIADKRSCRNKGRTRIELLMDRFSDQEGYQKIISYLRKGAYDITDNEVEELIAGSASRSRDEVISEFIRQKEEQAVEKREGYDKLEMEIIAEKVGPT